MKNQLYKSLLVLPVLLFVLPAVAQPSAPPATPIDGGLSALLVAGGLYGVKKIRDCRKEK
ncbi:PID-CTERM protein-sorting domain-containing protein [Marinoscillum sp.]|uniref:PID-CTERM protein-sorting domain-containing protein n=1 Tax=Marinoscillum sp. TaxID=2024838 RepID=UPI003BA99828